jgi:protein involved in polysaccharide export with SLBB domain
LPPDFAARIIDQPFRDMRFRRGAASPPALSALWRTGRFGILNPFSRVGHSVFKRIRSRPLGTLAVRVARGLFASLLVAAALPSGSRAQTPQDLQQIAAQHGVTLTHAQILQRIRESGMTQEQARAKLQEMGYPPGLADAYFDAMKNGTAVPEGFAGDSVMQALVRIGLASPVADTTPTALPGAVPPPVRAPVLVDSTAVGGLPIFGRELFTRTSSEFQPVTTGPVDPGYRLGPGDQVVLVLTGDVQASYSLNVTREGAIVIPEVGQMFVNGLTMEQLEDRLYDRLGQVYSSVGRGASAGTHFQLSLGQLRTNQVYLIGEVERPGAYQVSAVASVFNALYDAHGPSRDGSFRHIEVRRGGQVVQTVDLYDYLLHGDSRQDLRLEQGDVIFVPVAGKQVGIEGAVRRPALYEMLPDEGLADLLLFAGRVEAGAIVDRVQIDRILPPDARSPGVDRVLIDVDASDLVRGQGRNVALADGDLVHLFSVSASRHNRLTLTGEVNRPGIYEWSPGSTLWQLVDRASGLAPQAYTARAHIYRLNVSDGTRSLIRTPLLSDASGRRVADVPLADRDSVVIYSRAELVNPRTVAIEGLVKNPGQYALAEGMTVRDLILAAGGFAPGADRTRAEVARQADITTRTDTTARSFWVSLDETAPLAAAAAAPAPGPAGDAPAWAPTADELALQDRDRVFVRRAEGYEPARVVRITGEVAHPGAYVLERRDEQLLDLLQRAGGLTDQANPAGLRLVRAGELVGTNLPEAIRHPDGRYNLVLVEGDSIKVPERDPTVLVRGAVAFESRVLYRPGEDLGYYISQAGGYTSQADEGRVSVSYQNGSRAVVSKFLFHHSTPRVEPGATILVPAEAEGEGFDWDQFFGRTMSVVTTSIALILAAQRL